MSETMQAHLHRPLVHRVTVTDTKLLTPNMRRITVEGEALGSFEVPMPAQWLKIVLPKEVGKVQESRAYTIRRFYPGWRTMEIDFVLHGDTGPASSWVQRVEIGDVVHLGSPRGGYRINPFACWRLLAGDETALPAIASILDVLPDDDKPTWVVVEVPTTADIQSLHCYGATKALWNARDSSHPVGRLLSKALDGLSLPSGPGEIFLAGEATVVRMMKQLLTLRVPQAGLQAKGYWQLGEASH